MPVHCARRSSIRSTALSASRAAACCDLFRSWLMAEAEKKSFFSGLSGTLAAITALITAIGGLIAVLIQVGVIGGSGGSGSRGGAPKVAAASTAPHLGGEAEKNFAQTKDA